MRTVLTFIDRLMLQPGSETSSWKQARPALFASPLIVGLLASCTSVPLKPSDQHIARDAAGAPRPHISAPAPTAKDDIPAPVGGGIEPPRPRNGPKLETYSVVVNQVEVSELLFAMARDAKINVDVHPGVKGKVTLNAINQTMPQILTRLARQVDLAYEFDGKNLVVMPDVPFVRHYTVDYVNMTRESVANTSIATQIASAGRDPVSGASSGGGGSQASNNSTTQITNTSNNRFWDTLVANLRSMVTEPQPATQQGSGQSSGTPSTTGTPSGSGGSSGPGGSGGGSSTSSTTGGSSGSGSTLTTTTGSSGGSGASQAPSPVSANPETGIVSVRATNRQHERVRDYLDRVMGSARRQVMIEATIAEVQLSDQFQQGINWSRMRLDGSGFSFQMQPQGVAPLSTGAIPGAGPGGIIFPGTPNTGNLPGNALSSGTPNNSMGVLRYLNSTSSFGNIAGAVSLLQSFGKVKVLSSPKISVINNQTAVLKVVDNKVYFTIGVQITPGTATTAPLITYTSTPRTVPVGFVMSVTPQIEESGNVTINVRPTISRIIGYVNDPSPALAQANVTSRIPEIQTREMESILKVGSGDIAVMGGLMQESVDDRQDSVPGAAGLPIFGNLFKYRNDTSTKSELVIFLRPIVIRDASIEGDFRGSRDQLPGPDFFNKPDAPPVPRAWMRSEASR
jgi:general secretion pathway protein D